MYKVAQAVLKRREIPLLTHFELSYEMGDSGMWFYFLILENTSF